MHGCVYVLKKIVRNTAAKVYRANIAVQHHEIQLAKKAQCVPRLWVPWSVSYVPLLAHPSLFYFAVGNTNFLNIDRQKAE